MASEVKANKLSPSSGTTLTLGDASDTVTLPTGVTFNIVDGVPVASGGTGLASYTAGDILYATGSTTLAKLGKGTGLQGLQTNSGATAPEWANSPQSLMTAAGDVLYASGANTLAKLAKGSDDEVLTLASGVPSWAAAGGGKIGQLVSGTPVVVQQQTTSTSFVDVTNVNVAITPAATSSKILILATLTFSTPSATSYGAFDILRDTTSLGPQASYKFGRFHSDSSSYAGIALIQWLDSPSSTSELTYKAQFVAQSNTFTANVEGTPSFITVMEILA